MIIKKSIMKKVSKSRASKLIAYLMNETEKNKGIRVDHYKVINCCHDSIDYSAMDIEAVQSVNKRVSSEKTLHLIVSFQSNEMPAKNIIEEIESEIATKLGYGEHQRVFVCHADTDNYHMHMVINKINPQNFKCHTPYKDYEIMSKVAGDLELKFNLAVDNHIFRNKSNLGFERVSDIRSLQSFIKDNLQAIKACNTWKELHSYLHGKGIELKQKGAGMVFSSGGYTIKASSVDRSLSSNRLKEKMGDFIPNSFKISKNQYYKTTRKVHPLWDEYLNYKHLKDLLHKELEEKNQLKIQQAILAAKIRYKRLQDDKILSEDFIKHDNKIFLKDLLCKINQELYLIKKENKRLSWLDWLKEKALTDQSARNYLLSRKKESLTNINTLQVKGNKGYVLPIRYITAKGVKVFSKGVRQEKTDEYILDKANDYEVFNILSSLVKNNEQGSIVLKGSKKFKQNIIKIAAFGHLNITFNNDKLNEMYQAYSKQALENEAVRFYVDMPHYEKYMIKKLDAKWDYNKKSYYIDKKDAYKFLEYAHEKSKTIKSAFEHIKRATGLLEIEAKEIYKCKSWNELNNYLIKYNVRLKKHGAGFVFESNNIMIKASSIDRSLSYNKLTKKFGDINAKYTKNKK